VIKTFRSKPLADLFRTSKSAKIDARIQARVLRRLDVLDQATAASDMDIPGFDFHALRGFDPTRYTVHVNGPWCVTFSFVEGDAFDVDFEQYH
jgi:proteic killer suppression protein